MKNNEQFAEFQKNIGLDDQLRDAFKREHEQLSEWLHADAKIEKFLVGSFLQGSYKRSTAIRPIGDKRPDVDLIAVTTFDKNKVTAPRALDVFLPFVETHYGRPETRGHSWRVVRNGVEIDLVITAAPGERDDSLILKAALDGSESLEHPDFQRRYARLAASLQKAQSKTNGAWKFKPLDIPDRTYQVWEATHPLAQIQWTQDKNARCNQNYLAVVKGLKWWRTNTWADPKRPKGYPLEHLIGRFCPDGITSVAEGISSTLNRIVSGCQAIYHERKIPLLPDHGVDQNVWKHVSGVEFGHFYERAMTAANLAQAAFKSDDVDESLGLWRELLGGAFTVVPPATSNGQPRGSGGFSPRKEPSNPRDQRFA